MADKKRRDEEEERDAETEAEDKAEDDGEEESAEDNEDAASPEGDGDDEGEDNEAAQRVAKALGVDGEEGEAGEAGAADKDAETKEPEVIPNRAGRRREEAMARRKRRKGATAKAEDDDAPLPKDKNARAKELLKRRREQASGGGARPIQLLPGEMVDDALARTTSAATKWLRKNFSTLQWVILASLVGLGGFLLYSSQADKKAAAATNGLFQGVTADLGRVMAEDKRTDEEKEADPAKVYKTIDERSDAALAGFRKVIAEQRDSKMGQLAKLGEAGALLDKRDYAGAIDAYTVVLASKLAAADIDVKARATEGLGLAKEGKADLDGALAAYKDLENIDAKGYKELGMYQQGRILLAKGDKDKATEILKQLRDKLQTAGSDKDAYLYLQSSVDEALRRIDPSLVPQKSAATMGGPKGNSVSADEMGKIRKLIDDAAKKKQQPEEH